MEKRSSIINRYIKKQRFSTSKKPIPLPEKINISVIIPAYNEEFFLPLLINSINLQTYKNFEVIVVDNNSNDNTLKIVRGYRDKINYSLLVLEEKNPGPGNARKKGMDEVLKRISERNSLDYPKHILVIADADIIPPNNWIENILSNFKSLSSGALAGTHGASKKIDKIIEDQLGIKDYFNKIPETIESLANCQIGKIKMSGPNSAFEIEAYAAADGIQQSYDHENNRIGLKEVPQLGDRIRKAGYPILPMKARVTANKRRQLMELIQEENMYFPSGHDDKSRFFSIRENEEKLLKKALKIVPKERWIDYQKKSLKLVISNVILNPLLNSQIEIDSLRKILSKTEMNKLKKEIKIRPKGSMHLTNEFLQSWGETFEQAIRKKLI